MKYILVIDVADDVAKNYKALTVNYDLRGDYGEWDESIKYVEDAKPRPLPRHKITEFNSASDYNFGYNDGWNMCCEELEK